MISSSRTSCLLQSAYVSICYYSDVFGLFSLCTTVFCQGYDNPESCVRKASVLCLVALHNSVGSEKLEPYLESLNSSKVNERVLFWHTLSELERKTKHEKQKSDEKLKK